MTPRMKISRAGLDLIKAHEGYRRRAAKLPDGRWVVGYSHVQTAREGADISPEDAEALLLHDLKAVTEAINDLVLAPLSRNQFDALVSLAFNIGVRQFRLSGIVGHINEGRPLDAAACFDVWRKAVIDGKAVVVDALVRRRAVEKALFLTPKTGPIAAPSAEASVVADPDAVYIAPMEGAVAAEINLNGDKAGARTAARDPGKAASAAQGAADQIVDRLNEIVPASDKDDDLRDHVGASRRVSARQTPGRRSLEAAFDDPPPPRASSRRETGAPPRFVDPPVERWEGDVEVEPAAMARPSTGMSRPWVLGAGGFALMMASVYGVASLASAPEPTAWRAVMLAGLIFGALSVFTSVYTALKRAGRLIGE